jgi:hypothetical protein
VNPLTGSARTGPSGPEASADTLADPRVEHLHAATFLAADLGNVDVMSTRPCAMNARR